mmetsp:Transcript_5990/g.13933  ORF Transcript_5990/g.13933 Transcript_5990/m.13933 type:complete len:209 (+) Transcript_5990:118-744(+)
MTTSGVKRRPSAQGRRQNLQGRRDPRTAVSTRTLVSKQHTIGHCRSARTAAQPHTWRSHTRFRVMCVQRSRQDSSLASHTSRGSSAVSSRASGSRRFTTCKSRFASLDRRHVAHSAQRLLSAGARRAGRSIRGRRRCLVLRAAGLRGVGCIADSRCSGIHNGGLGHRGCRRHVVERIEVHVALDDRTKHAVCAFRVFGPAPHCRATPR